MTTTQNAPYRSRSRFRSLTRIAARRRIVVPSLLLLVTTLLVSSAGDGLIATPLAGRQCDFNNDGFEDLAIGIPSENVGTIVNAGAVNVIYGSGAGLTAAGDQIWHQDRPSVLGVAETGDAFGFAVRCGRFNQDQYDDLAIGAPGEDVGETVDAGAVHVLFGSASGLTATGNQMWQQDDFADQPETGDRFGDSLAAGDFNDDYVDDLAIGVPYEDLDGNKNAGAVHAVYGGGSGLRVQGNQFWNEGSPQVPSTLVRDESFGTALAAGDFNNDGFDDLAIGIPGEDVAQSGGAAAQDGGAVILLKGSNSGLVSSGSQFWHQGNLAGVHEDGDAFGSTLAAGDFDDDGFDDLAVGVPGEDVGELASAGAVNVIYGSGTMLISSGSQVWHLDSAGVPGVAAKGDAFGAALAAGDLNGDGTDDLAIGVPSKDVDDTPDAGAATVLFGSASGLDDFESVLLHQDVAYIEGVAETADAFGSSLGAGDFNGDGTLDLAAGVPGESVDGVANAGAVSVLYGADWGPSGSGDQIWHQGVAGIEGVVEQRDHMGNALPTSDGVYRLPFVNGTSVYVWNDHFTHNPDRYEYDIYGTGSDDGEYAVVAAASGWIKVITDSYTGPDHNNQVWIEHANGEWTKYTHLETNSVTDLGHWEGRWVSAGTVIGIEGNVGTSVEHVHFQVMVPDAPPDSRDGQTRVPLICGIPGNIMQAGRTYTAGPC